LNIKQLKNIPPWDWPKNAETVVLDTLTNRHAAKKDRLLAAELSGEYSILCEKIADALLNVVCSNEESPELRSKAAISLGPALEEADFSDYDDPNDLPALSAKSTQKVQKALHALYADAEIPKNVRRAVLEASVRHPQDWHVDAIRNAYNSKDDEWQLTAVFCMHYVQGFETQILKSLNSSNPLIRFHAVGAAGNWEIDAAWPAIARMITSDKTEKSLLLEAIEAAAAIRPTETEIIEPLVDSYDDDISEAAMEALAEAGHASDWDSEDYDEDDFEDDEDEDYEDEDEEDKNDR
jgi:hypothetical protein